MLTSGFIWRSLLLSELQVKGPTCVRGGTYVRERVDKDDVVNKVRQAAVRLWIVQPVIHRNGSRSMRESLWCICEERWEWIELETRERMTLALLEVRKVYLCLHQAYAGLRTEWRFRTEIRNSQRNCNRLLVVSSPAVLRSNEYGWGRESSAIIYYKRSLKIVALVLL